MNPHHWIELALYIAILVLITKPLGLFINRVLNPGSRTFLDPVIRPLEKLTYRLLGVDPAKEQTWKQYAFTLLIFSAVTCLFTYAILRVQYYLPLNPQKFTGLAPHLAFNTAISFLTNTNWQSYGGESTMSNFSQMVALVFHNFFSAAAGIAVAAALVRGLARHTSDTIGNFWVDITRIIYYLLLPICIIYASFLVSQGCIQNFQANTTATIIETNQMVSVQQTDSSGNPVKDTNGNPVMVSQVLTNQTIVQGPVASQMAIKMLGTNGGGFMNANAAHPFENPTPFSDFIQMLSILAIVSALTYHVGRETKNQKHGWAVWQAMFVMFLAGLFAMLVGRGKTGEIPSTSSSGIVAADGNMEGKEVRFGIFESALFATVTTDASCGAVNCMHDSLDPIGRIGADVQHPNRRSHLRRRRRGALRHVDLRHHRGVHRRVDGRADPGISRQEARVLRREDGAAGLCDPGLHHPGLHGVGLRESAWGLAGLNNQGPHGFSEIHYAYTSGAGNNGSAFAGLNANTPWYDTTLAFDMVLGRFGMIIPLMALAGSLAKKKLVPTSAGTFPISGVTFVLLLIGTVLLVGALTFVPALALGPIVEHFLMLTGKLF